MIGLMIVRTLCFFYVFRMVDVDERTMNERMNDDCRLLY